MIMIKLKKPKEGPAAAIYLPGMYGWSEEKHRPQSEDEGELKIPCHTPRLSHFTIMTITKKNEMYTQVLWEV